MFNLSILLLTSGVSVILSLIHWNGCAFEMLICNEIGHIHVIIQECGDEESEEPHQLLFVPKVDYWTIWRLPSTRVSSNDLVRFRGGSLRGGGGGGGTRIENNIKNGPSSGHHLKPSSCCENYRCFQHIFCPWQRISCIRRSYPS